MFAVNDRKIFSIGGESDAIKYLGVFEALNLSKLVAWETIKVVNSFSERRSFQGIQIKYNEVLIIGGVMNSGGATSECYSLKVNSDNVECSKHSVLEREAYFITCPSPIFDYHNVYAIENSGYLHRYSLSRNKWEAIIIN